VHLDGSPVRWQAAGRSFRRAAGLSITAVLRPEQEALQKMLLGAAVDFVVVEANRSRLLAFITDDPGVLADIDRPADLAKLEAVRGLER
jgi:CTP:molybdopterin cytidylyltransferase MocA